MKKTILSGVIIAIIGLGQVTTFAALKPGDYGSNVNTKNGMKHALAWTSAPKGARAKVSMGGGLDDKMGNGYVQTGTVSKWGTPTAHIGHGENGNITIAFQK